MELLPDCPELLSISEVSELLKLSKLTITRLIDEGEIHIEDTGKIRKSILIDFLDDNLTLNIPLMEVDDVEALQ